MFMHAGISLSPHLHYASTRLLKFSHPFVTIVAIFVGSRRGFCHPFFIMMEYFKYLRQLLAMQGESFEEELQRLVTFIFF